MPEKTSSSFQKKPSGEWGKTFLRTNQIMGGTLHICLLCLYLESIKVCNSIIIKAGLKFGKSIIVFANQIQWVFIIIKIQKEEKHANYCPRTGITCKFCCLLLFCQQFLSLYQ